MSTEQLPSFDRDELSELVEEGLAPYRRLLSASVLRHFRGATLFFLEVHPAALQWQGVLRSTWRARRAAGPSPPTGTPRLDDGDAESGMILGFTSERTAQAEHDAELLAHEAEAGLRCLVGASFPPAETPAEGERALRHLVDIALAALFCGVVGTLLRRSSEDEAGHGASKVSLPFVSANVLFARICPTDKDALTFTAYFTYRHSFEVDAKQHGRSVAEEQQDVVRFLERFARTLVAGVPQMARAVRAALIKTGLAPAGPPVSPPSPIGGRARRGTSRRRRS